MQKVIITGATSLIGVALTELLLKCGCRIHAIMRESSPNVNELPYDKNLLVHNLDIREIERLPQLISEPCDIFFHLAWLGTNPVQRTDLSVQHENILITVQAVQAAKKLGCKKFIATGSQAEYGILTGPAGPETPTKPTEPYGASKLAAYHLSHVTAKQLAIEHIWARIFSVYGPHENKNTLINTLIQQLTAGEIPQLTKCEQIWDYLYVSDAAQALAAMAESGKPNSIYCVGSGFSHPLREYVQKTMKAVSADIQPKFGAKAYAENQVMYLQADIQNLTADTGFVPAISFETGILETVRWLTKKRRQ